MFVLCFSWLSMIGRIEFDEPLSLPNLPIANRRASTSTSTVAVACLVAGNHIRNSYSYVRVLVAYFPLLSPHSLLPVLPSPCASLRTPILPLSSRSVTHGVCRLLIPARARHGGSRCLLQRAHEGDHQLHHQSQRGSSHWYTRYMVL